MCFRCSVPLTAGKVFTNVRVNGALMLLCEHAIHAHMCWRAWGRYRPVWHATAVHYLGPGPAGVMVHALGKQWWHMPPQLCITDQGGVLEGCAWGAGSGKRSTMWFRGLITCMCQISSIRGPTCGRQRATEY